MQSGNSGVEDMEEGSSGSRRPAREAEMVEGSDYEEFSGYNPLTSFDLHLLRAFGSLGSGLRFLSVRTPACPKHQLLAALPVALGGCGGAWGGQGWLLGGGPSRTGTARQWCKRVQLPACLPLSLALQNEPWELDNPVLAQTLVEALQLDPETLANETAARAANIARSAASNRAARAAAAAARRSFNQVMGTHRPAAAQASRPARQPATAARAPGADPETSPASPQSSPTVGTSAMAAPGAPGASSAPSPTACQAQEAVSEGPSAISSSSQAPSFNEMDATRPNAAFLGPRDAFDFTQPAGVSGLAFPRPKRPAPAQEVAPEGPSDVPNGPQAAPAGEVEATRPKMTKSGKALAKTRWVEPQNVAAAAAAKAKAAMNMPEPEPAASSAQHGAEPWARMGGKRTKKVRPAVLPSALLSSHLLLLLALLLPCFLPPPTLPSFHPRSPCSSHTSLRRVLPALQHPALSPADVGPPRFWHSWAFHRFPAGICRCAAGSTPVARTCCVVGGGQMLGTGSLVAPSIYSACRCSPNTWMRNTRAVKRTESPCRLPRAGEPTSRHCRCDLSWPLGPP